MTAQMKGGKRQTGSVLVVGLIMLVLLTLMALSSINSTTTSLQVIGNAQFRDEATAAAQQAIETVISTSAFTSAPPAPQAIDVNGDGASDYTVTFVPAPACRSYRAVDTTVAGLPTDCYGSIGAVCFWTVWDISAVVNDAATGANVTVHQGVRTIAGINSALTYCGL